MPKVPISKAKITVSLDLGLLLALKKKAKGSCRKLSQQINYELKKVLSMDMEYMAYELGKCMEEAEVWRFKIRRAKAEKKAKEEIKR